MNGKGASKNGSDGCGQWHLDDHGMPCYEWDLRTTSPDATVRPHIIGTGWLQATADPWGRIEIYDGNAEQRFCLTDGAHGGSALRLELQAAGNVLPVIPACVPDTWKPRLIWGQGYVTYDRTVKDPALPTAIHLRTHVLSCAGRPYFLVEVQLSVSKALPEPLAVALVASTDLNPRRSTLGARGFARDGAAILSLGDETGDAFLAGSSGWQSSVVHNRLQVRQEIALRPGEPISLRLLIGLTGTCSRPWLIQQFAGLTSRGIMAAAAEETGRVHPPGSELWLREDILWCRSSLGAFRALDPVTDTMILQPAAGTAVTRTAHTLVLCPMLQQSHPEWVRDTLIALTHRIDSHGKPPETLRHGASPDCVTSAQERSDTPIWFIWAWSQWLAEDASRGRILAQQVRERERGGPTLLSTLLTVLGHTRHTLGVGPHGLIRMLAGDWDGILDRAGIAGVGESSLNTAILCVALRSLSDVCRLQHDGALAHRLDAWARELLEALGEAFANGAFLRGYTDAGAAIGKPPDDPVFTNVQAWAILARAGTVSQRQLALDTILTACGEGPLRLLTIPYPGSLPDELSSHAVAPGYGANAGVGLMEAAWFMQALAMEDRVPEAVAAYTRLCLRRRAAGNSPPAFPSIAWSGRLNGPAAQRQALFPEPDWAFEPPPQAYAVAWQEAVLRCITG